MLALGVLVLFATGTEVNGVVDTTFDKEGVVLSLEPFPPVLPLSPLLPLSTELSSVLVVSLLESSFPFVVGSLVSGVSVFCVSGVTTGSLGSVGAVGSVGVVGNSLSPPISVSGLVSSDPFSVVPSPPSGSTFSPPCSP